MSKFPLPKIPSGLICLAGPINSGRNSPSNNIAPPSTSGNLSGIVIQNASPGIESLMNGIAKRLASERAEKERVSLEENTSLAKSKPRKNRL